MASINLQDIILDNRDLEIGNINTYTLNSDLIIGEIQLSFLERLTNFKLHLQVLLVKVETQFHLRLS